MKIKRQISVLAMAAALTMGAAASACAQNISQIAQSDPLIITGAVGTQNTYRYTSTGNNTGSPLSNTVYANLNISVYGISMPFTFCYSNSNTSFTYPHFTFNISPTYKNWTAHFGKSSMAMSSYVMNMSYNGVGVEYNDQKMRFGLFYGTLRSAINDDPTQEFARSPQYKRMGWGAKIGYGSKNAYADIYFLRAYDREKSLDEVWRTEVRPQENIVLGFKGGLTPAKWVNLTLNAATSAFNTDTEAKSIATSTSFDKIFDTKYSSMMRFAGDVSANFSLPFFQTNIVYKVVQPKYTSLGTYYMSNNYHSLGINASTSLFKKVTLTANFSGQQDNLSKEQLYTTEGYVYSASLGTRIGNLNLAATYNGYLQTQSDGTMQVTDSSHVKRVMSSYSFMPSYSIDAELLAHTFALSLNYTENKDLNKFANGESDVKTLAAGLSYGLSVKPWEVNFSAALSHQQSEGYKTKYSSDVLSLSASRAFLADRNLDLSTTFSMCYNHVERQSKSLSMACDVSASYTLNDVHVFSASASMNKYGDVNVSKIRSSLDATDVTVSLNYAYTFSLVEIKSKGNKDKEKDK